MSPGPGALDRICRTYKDCSPNQVVGYVDLKEDKGNEKRTNIDKSRVKGKRSYLEAFCFCPYFWWHGFPAIWMQFFWAARRNGC